MDPNSYQNLMIQQLMGAGGAPQGTTGSLPTTPYGQSMVTGNGMAVQQAQQAGQQPGQMPGMLGAPAPSQTMMQPMQAYPSAPPQ